MNAEAVCYLFFLFRCITYTTRPVTNTAAAIANGTRSTPGPATNMEVGPSALPMMPISKENTSLKRSQDGTECAKTRYPKA